MKGFRTILRMRIVMVLEIIVAIFFVGLIVCFGFVFMDCDEPIPMSENEEVEL